MKQIAIAFLAIVVVALVTSQLFSNDQIKAKILKLFPAADSDRDGKLSAVEYKAVCDQAIQRYPKADLDKDGRLSPEEQSKLLDQVAAKQGSEPTIVNEAGDSPDLQQEEIRQGPRLIDPGESGIGKMIENLSFSDIHGNSFSLDDFAESQAVVIALTGTGCPLCLKYAPTLGEIERTYSQRSVAFFFVNPNDSERADKIATSIKTHGFQGPYVQDGKLKIPRSLGAQTTTEVFVLDRAKTLVYRGAVDDQYGFAYSRNKPQKTFLTDALDSIIGGETPKVQATSSPGCDLYYETEPQFDTKVTYHNRISRIIQSNCLECHRDGGIAPMALETYEEVTDYAGMITNVVDRGVMPPWFAAPLATEKNSKVSHWANDRSLSEQEKEDLRRWIASGTPMGNPEHAPLKKTFPDGWLIGKPDAVYEFPQPIQIKATGTMPYQYVTVETDLSEDKWVQAIEVRPGKLDVVHHVIVSVRSDDGEFDESDGYWGAYVPGNSTLIYPEGYARLLPKGAKLRFQMHYTPNGIATKDSTRIGVIFSDQPPRHEVKVAGIAKKGIRIPANAPNHKESADLTLPFDIEVLSFLPHMHLRGKAARYESVSRNKTETLLDIPRYDFNWQLQYKLAEPLRFSQGDKIRFSAWYDNSAKNPANPDPNRVVRWGQQTEDEMHLGYVEYIVVGAEPGSPIQGIRRGRSRGARNQPERLNSDAIIQAIRKIDRDNDGTINRADVPSDKRKIFDRLDSDSDGTLTEKEAILSLKKFNRGR